jgi:histidinol phosphatase-like enzyme (inositol monophosphatase family)
MTRNHPDLQEILSFAQDLAHAAGLVTLEHFGGVLASEEKRDGTPVTVADRAAEALLRRRIEARYPDHGVLGEEYGASNPDAPVQWILDPIDGTRSFMRGVPLYGVLIGVQEEGRPSVGVAHFPALGETVAAAMGLGCSWNGRPARVSRVSELARSTVLTTDPLLLLDDALRPGWERMVRAATLARTWGDCYGHVLVATGRAEVMVDPVLSPWDAAPFVPILVEAGGLFTDRSGVARADGGSGISSNGLLHPEILALLGRA